MLLTSVLPRATLAAPSLGALATVEDWELCELHPGECDGLSFAEYERRYPRTSPANPDRPLSPGGESVNGFDRRVRATPGHLIEGHDGQTMWWSVTAGSSWPPRWR